LITRNTDSTTSATGYKASNNKLANGRTAVDFLLNGKVVVRLYLSEAQASYLTSAKTTVQLAGTRVAKTTNKIKKYYKDTPFHVVSFDRQGKFASAVETAVKIPAEIGKTSLALYNYDAKTNKLTRIKGANLKFDKNGFLHFKTDYAGDIIVSKGKLEKNNKR
jgi:hypothetical protein